jgi:hypothetical protein
MLSPELSPAGEVTTQTIYSSFTATSTSGPSQLPKLRLHTREVRMASTVKKKIVVAGGNGFLGSRICKSAVARGWDVTSVRHVLSLPYISYLLASCSHQLSPLLRNMFLISMCM